MSLRGTNGRPSAATIVAWSVVAVVLGGAGAGSSHAQSGGSTPFGGSPFLIPARADARLEAENFDRGAEGSAYHDTDAANAGRQFRADDGVDIGLCTDTDGGYRVGWIGSGEWLKYSVRVSTAGKYNITFRVSSRAAYGAAGGKMHLEDARGTNLTGDVNITGTGDTWQDVRANNVPLSAGDQALKLVFDAGGFNLNYMNFSPAPVEATPQAPAAQAQAQDVVVVAEEPVANPAPASSRGIFAEEATIGEGAKGTLSYAEPGRYTLRGGTKVGGKADAAYLVSSKAQGDGQIIAKVESVDGTGSAGVMYRESADADARFAAVLVTAGNGTVFQRRSETGGSALSAMAPGAKAPVWIRLVRTGTNFSAFYASSAEQPGEADWKPIGAPKAVAMGETALAGLVSAAGEGSAVLGSVSIGGAVVAAAEPAQEAITIVSDSPAQGAAATAGQLTGRVIGTEGSYDGNGNTREKAFDGDLSTYFDPPAQQAMTAWTGLDFGTPRRITRIAYCPRTGYAFRVVNAKLQASNSPTFGPGTVDLYTITQQGSQGQLTTVDVNVPGTYRYFRYVGGTDYVSVSEIKVFGN